MPIRDKGRRDSPGQELKNFTDRDNELADFRSLLLLDEPTLLPAVMFFGVGGTGKSWLLKRFRSWLVEQSTLPSAYIDFDRRAGGPSFINDFSAILVEMWRQLDVECPRFEMAYAWMRFKQGANDRPLVRHSGRVSTGWEFVKEASSAGLSWVPGFNLIVWATDKLGKFALRKIEQTPFGKHLLTRVGHEDFVGLSRQTAQEIFQTLTERLGADLNEQLPMQESRSCRAVVFLDTFEELAGGESNDARRHVAEEPVRTLYEHLTCVLLVMFGRDRLIWDEVDPAWADRANLEQHLLGGLSRHDATQFLGKCGIEPGQLLEAILRVSHDRNAAAQEAFYPFSLGLCADTVVVERARGIEPQPETFEIPADDYRQLTLRFLKSLHDEHPEQWIIQLAQTHRFDEIAARAMFSPVRDVHQDKVWESLRDYSFVEEDVELGWFRFHSMMSSVLRRRRADDLERFVKAHKEWHGHWLSRSEHDTDAYARLAWYHEYVLNPELGLINWEQKAEQARSARDMTVHLDLIDWWTPTAIEKGIPGTKEQAGALVSLGSELWHATLGNRSTNLRRAIGCYEAALRVQTESDFPSAWAMTQNNLGNAYSHLPTGDRDENLRRAIECYEAALAGIHRVGLPVGLGDDAEQPGHRLQ